MDVLIFFLILLGGGGYVIYWYFTKYRPSHKSKLRDLESEQLAREKQIWEKPLSQVSYLDLFKLLGIAIVYWITLILLAFIGVPESLIKVLYLPVSLFGLAFIPGMIAVTIIKVYKKFR